jgi:hypothetical protein
MPFDAGSPVPSFVLDSPLPTHPFPWLHALDQDGNANGEITYSSCWRHRTCCPLVLDPTHRQPQKASPAAQTTTKLHQRLLPAGRWRPTDPFVATSTLASWSWIWLQRTANCQHTTRLYRTSRSTSLQPSNPSRSRRLSPKDLSTGPLVVAIGSHLKTSFHRPNAFASLGPRSSSIRMISFTLPLLGTRLLIIDTPVTVRVHRNTSTRACASTPLQDSGS